MLRVYNRFLDLLVETSSFQSLQFPRNYHGIGNFELHINRYSHGADSIQKGNIIALDKYKAGIIQTKEIALDENGKASENFKLTGYTLDGLMERRITVPPSHTSHDRKKGNAETVMKHYVERNFLNPDDSNRHMRSLEIAPNKNRGVQVDWESRYKNVADELEEISKESGLGWRIYADFKRGKYVFDCFEAKDLRQGNPYGNHPVMFSPDFGTVESQSFVDSDNELRNVGYVGGQGEGKERKIVTVGDAEGWERIETFVDARDISGEDEETEEELTDEEVEQLLIERGEKKMREMKTLLSFDAEILTPVTRKSYEYTHEGYRHPGQPVSKIQTKTQQITPFEYEKDFDIGDIVDVVNKSWGVKMSVPIIEITEIHEPGGFRLEAVFGDSLPLITDKLDKRFNELEDIDKEESYYEYVDKKQKDTDKKIEHITPSEEKLWEGAVFVMDVHTIRPTKKLSECVNGWRLLWTQYVEGEGAYPGNIQYSEIPKITLDNGEGRGHRFSLNRASYDVEKYIYVDDDMFTGRTNNGEGDNRELVLTAVYEF